MTDPASTVFVVDGVTGPGSRLVREQVAPRTGDASLEAIREDLAVRDTIARYFYAFDQDDLDTTLALFTDDCVLTNARGAFHGREAVRQAHETMTAASRRFHYVSNQVVALSPDLRAAVVTSYHYAIVDPASGPPKAVGGVIADRLVKTDDGWKIARRTTTIDFSFALSAAG